MSDHVTSLRWLGNQLDADAADKGIGQGSEGARICWNAAMEIESLRQQLADQREAFAVIAETPVSGEQDDITMEAKDRIAKAIRAWEPKP